MLRHFTALALTTLVTSSAPAEFPRGDLQGSWALHSRNIIDPGPDERPDRVLLSLEGEGAKQLFEAMPGIGREANCAGEATPGVRTKVGGGLECTQVASSRYQCSVGVMLNDGRTTRGYVCD